MNNSNQKSNCNSKGRKEYLGKIILNIQRKYKCIVGRVTGYIIYNQRHFKMPTKP